MKTIFCLILLIVLLMQNGQAQGVNVELIGQVKTRGTGNYSACWRYVDSSGREYALLACNTGVQIIDISTNDLKEVAFIPNAGWPTKEMKTYSHYAYIVNAFDRAGMQIVDLSKLPDSVTLVNTYFRNSVPMSAHTISAEGKYLYLNGINGSEGITILDLTDPVHPVVVGSYQKNYVHDCTIQNDTIYASGIGGVGLDIIDATDKANMKRINLITYPYAATHNSALSYDNNYIFTADETSREPGLRVWDKSNLQNIKLVGSYHARPKTITHNINVKGRYGYLAHYSEGLRILDLSVPEIPVEVASFDTYPGSTNSFDGAWDGIPYLSSNKVIVSDRNEGLFVLKFPGEDSVFTISRARVTVRDSWTNMVLSGISAMIMETEFSTVTDGDGMIKFGLLNDTATIRFSNPVYSNSFVDKKISLKFDSTINVTTHLDIARSNIYVRNAITNALVPGVTIRLAGYDNTFVTNSEGKIYLEFFQDTITVLLSKTGFDTAYIPVTKKLTLRYDSLAAITVYLTPEPRAPVELTAVNKYTGKPIDNLSLVLRGTPISGKTDSIGTFRALLPINSQTFTFVGSRFAYGIDSLSFSVSDTQQYNLRWEFPLKIEDDFEFDFGWSVGAANDSGSLGKWKRSKATAAKIGLDTLQPSEDHTPNGSYYWVTGAESVPQDYPVNRTTLTSPSFGLAGVEHPVLIYWCFFNSRSSDFDDTLYVQFSNDNGTTWKTGETVTGKHPRWVQHRIDIKEVISPSETMRLRFVARNGGKVTIFDAAIDDVRIGNDLQLTAPFNSSTVPTEFLMMQNYPNPFNPHTTISFSLPHHAHTTLHIYDILGSEVETVVNNMLAPGTHSYRFSATESGLSSGIYFYTLKSGERMVVRKMMLLK